MNAGFDTQIFLSFKTHSPLNLFQAYQIDYENISTQNTVKLAFLVH